MTKKIKYLNQFTLIITQITCVYSFVVATLLLFGIFDVPAQYQMIDSFYTGIFMSDLHEWFYESAEVPEYIWIFAIAAYIYGKIILTSVLAAIAYKKPKLGAILTICVIIGMDITAWLFTVTHSHLKEFVGFAVICFAVRAIILAGYIIQLLQPEREKHASPQTV